MKKHLSLMSIGLLFCIEHTTIAQTTQDILRSSVTTIKSDSSVHNFLYFYKNDTSPHIPDKESNFLGELGFLIDNKADSTAFTNTSKSITIETKEFDNQRRVVKRSYFDNDEIYKTERYAYHSNGSVASYLKEYTSGEYEKQHFFEDGRSEVDTFKVVDGNDTVLYTKVYNYSSSNQLLSTHSIALNFVTPNSNTIYSFDSTIYTYNNINDTKHSIMERYETQYKNGNWLPTIYHYTHYLTYNTSNEIVIDSIVYKPNDYYSYSLNSFTYLQDTTIKIEQSFERSSGNLSIQSKKETIEVTDNNLTVYNETVYQWSIQNQTYYIINGSGHLRDADDIYYEMYYTNLDQNGNPYTDTTILQRNNNKNIIKLENKSIVINYNYETKDISVNNIIKNDQVAIYPNPSSGIVQIEVKSINNYDVVLYNAMGQLLGHYHNISTIDLEHRASGNYIIHIIDVATKASISKKVTKL